MAKIYKDKRYLIVQNAYVDWKTGVLISPIETADFTIVQVAESYFIGGFETGAHNQFCDLEMTLPLTGTLNCFANDVGSRVEKNEVYLSFKGEKHSLYSKSSCRFITLAVNFKTSSVSIFSDIKRQFSNKRTVPSSKFHYLASRIVAEFSSDIRPFFNSYVNALLNELFISVTRYTSISESPKKANSHECLAKIAGYIDCNYLNICSAEELSKFGYSYQYICKLFKDIYGISPGAYLLSKRMDHAANSLSQGESVSAVAHVLGYSSPYNFSRAFKKHFGYPPSQKNQSN